MNSHKKKITKKMYKKINENIVSSFFKFGAMVSVKFDINQSICFFKVTVRINLKFSIFTTYLDI